MVSVVLAQRDERLFSSSSVSLGVGVCSYNVGGVSTQGFDGQLSYGAWMVSDMVLRLRGEVRNVDALHFNLCCDVMWDPLTSFSGTIHSDRVIDVYPMVGFGLAVATNAFAKSDPDFTAMVGVEADFRLPSMPRWSLFVEANYHLMLRGYDGNGTHSNFLNLLAGVRHEFADNNPKNRRNRQMVEWHDNWFFAFSLGPSFSVTDVAPIKTFGFFNRAAGNFDFVFGRNLNTLWTLRCGVSYMEGKSFDGVSSSKYSFFGVRGDVMFNVSNLQELRRGARLNVLPYVGAGIYSRFDNSHPDMSADAGVMFRWYITHSIDLSFDGRYMLVPPRFVGGYERWANGFVVLNAGITYNITPSTRYTETSTKKK